jgi:5-formyltetrahydrofolate cyclo-ligase
MINTQKLRKEILNKRAKLPPPFQRETALKVANFISNINIFKKSKHIAAYFPVRGEMDPRPLIEQAWQEHKTSYLPIVMENYKLSFAEYNKNDLLINNLYSIPEPCRETSKLINPKDLDIVIMPLVAFDINGNRLGTGTGYYDRTFAFTKQLTRRNKPYLIGIAYEFQKAPDLSPQPWDVPLNMVVTEARIYKITGKKQFY